MMPVRIFVRANNTRGGQIKEGEHG